ncbi:UNVERIFIED_CONTAM: protein SICKLE [Sesamum radiatum]|uniref:Protein SICKLE n=1 Tax=Sesamum radiatum TaxID=300843 RepID=A0AAW2M6L1_SESRA
MEESEKRRERLKAMRMEAARAGVNTDSESSGLPSRGLSNPLIESETTSASPLQYTSPRFDYYTDPMAAFSGVEGITPLIRTFVSWYDSNSGLSKCTSQPSMSENIPPPGAQFSHGPFRSPMEANSPLGRPHFSHGPLGSPMKTNSPLSSPQGNPPGRGRGRSTGSSRGRGSRGAVSAELRPDLYYSKGMMEDPWKNMTPVVWKGVPATDSDKSWLPKSIQMKKAKVSSEGSQPSISQQSLAEYLAATFNDSNDEAVDEEGGT